jgi:hypothetical protein
VAWRPPASQSPSIALSPLGLFRLHPVADPSLAYLDTILLCPINVNIDIVSYRHQSMSGGVEANRRPFELPSSKPHEIQKISRTFPYPPGSLRFQHPGREQANWHTIFRGARMASRRGGTLYNEA